MLFLNIYHEYITQDQNVHYINQIAIVAELKYVWLCK